tara:strand:+ start:3111 stop:3917 length:807 start_codon:yes stop_codon:yes gene_type:complete
MIYGDIHGNYMFVKPIDLELERLSLYNTARNEKNQLKRTQQPTLTLKAHGRYMRLFGRTLFWDMMDALYAKEPLSRSLVNQDLWGVDNIFHKRTLVQSLINESKTRYLCFRLKGDEVVVVKNTDDESPDNTLRFIQQWSMESLADWACISAPIPYVDKSGHHMRDGLLFTKDDMYIRVIDLGSRLFITGDFVVNGISYAPLDATVFKKHEDYFYLVMKDLVLKHAEVLSKCGRDIGTTLERDLTDDDYDYMRTSELSTLAHERWLRSV